MKYLRISTPFASDGETHFFIQASISNLPGLGADAAVVFAGDFAGDFATVFTVAFDVTFAVVFFFVLCARVREHPPPDLT